MWGQRKPGGWCLALFLSLICFEKAVNVTVVFVFVCFFVRCQCYSSKNGGLFVHALYQPKNYQSRYVASNTVSVHRMVTLHSLLDRTPLYCPLLSCSHTSSACPIAPNSHALTLLQSHAPIHHFYPMLPWSHPPVPASSLISPLPCPRFTLLPPSLRLCYHAPIPPSSNAPMIPCPMLPPCLPSCLPSFLFPFLVALPNV